MELISSFSSLNYSREAPTSSETNATGFFGSAASQSNLQSLGHINILGSRGLNIHDMTMDQPSAQYDDQKKAKLEVNMGFASSPTNGTAAEAATESFTNQSDHANGTASNWHQAHHHAQAYTNAQYPTSYFSQVDILYTMKAFRFFWSISHLVL